MSATKNKRKSNYPRSDSTSKSVRVPDLFAKLRLSIDDAPFIVLRPGKNIKKPLHGFESRANGPDGLGSYTMATLSIVDIHLKIFPAYKIHFSFSSI